MRHLSGAHSRPLFLSCSERFINDRRNERTKLVRSEVRIELEYSEHEVPLLVSDDGVGFDAPLC